ncbi:MAG: hypothetical protein CME91_13695 [Hyphomonadaceae bacterium]|nr:hypothetical protein [Hyphomonadaceae bacterium]
MSAGDQMIGDGARKQEIPGRVIFAPLKLVMGPQEDRGFGATEPGCLLRAETGHDFGDLFDHVIQRAAIPNHLLTEMCEDDQAVAVGDLAGLAKQTREQAGQITVAWPAPRHNPFLQPVEIGLGQGVIGALPREHIAGHHANEPAVPIEIGAIHPCIEVKQGLGLGVGFRPARAHFERNLPRILA